MVGTFVDLLPKEDEFWSNPEQEIEEEDSLKYLFQVMRDQGVTQDTLVIMLQCMYFTEYGVYLVTTPMHKRGVSSDDDLVEIDNYSINSQMFGGSANFNKVDFSGYFKGLVDSGRTVKVEPGTIVFSAVNSAQFLTNLANTGKTHATFFARVWSGIFGDIFEGISYTVLADYIKEIGGTNFNNFMYNWGFHRNNAYYLQTLTISTPTTMGRATLVKQFFEPVEKNKSQVSKYMTQFAELLTLVGVDEEVAKSYTTEIFANKLDNGFFTVPQRNIHLVMQMLINNLLTDINEPEFFGGLLHINKLLETKYYTKQLQTTYVSYDKVKHSFSKVYGSNPFNKATFSLNTRLLIPDEIWYDEEFDKQFVTNADMVLLLVALFKKVDINDLKNYIEGNIQKNEIKSVKQGDYQSYLDYLKPQEVDVVINDDLFDNPVKKAVTKCCNAVKQTVVSNDTRDTMETDFVKKVIFKAIPQLRESNVSIDKVRKQYVTYKAGEIKFDWEKIKSGVFPTTKDNKLATVKENLKRKTLVFNSQWEPEQYILDLLAYLLEY
jgi:hypothetical protein